MAKGTQRESKGIRIPRLAVKKLERVQERIAARTGAECSLPKAMTSAISIAERMLDPAYQAKQAQDLALHTQKNTVRLVKLLTDEDVALEKAEDGKSYVFKYRGRAVVVADTVPDLEQAMGQPLTH